MCTDLIMRLEQFIPTIPAFVTLHHGCTDFQIAVRALEVGDDAACIRSIHEVSDLTVPEALHDNSRLGRTVMQCFQIEQIALLRRWTIHMQHKFVRRRVKLFSAAIARVKFELRWMFTLRTSSIYKVVLRSRNIVGCASF